MTPLRSVTWQQVCLFLGSLVAVLCAARFVPGLATDLTATVALVLNFLVGRDGSGPTPPKAPVIPAFMFSIAMVAACANFPLDTNQQINDHARLLEKCQEEGRDAGAYKAYATCKAREGL